jgi:hypothetical protein
MIELFIALGIGILTLLTILLWFVIHFLEQRETHFEIEITQLREIVCELTDEQEYQVMQQDQLITSISYLQNQIVQVVTVRSSNENTLPILTTFDQDAIETLGTRMSKLQVQIDNYADVLRRHTRQKNESWMYVIMELNTIQGHIGQLGP